MGEEHTPSICWQGLHHSLSVQARTESFNSASLHQMFYECLYHIIRRLESRLLSPNMLSIESLSGYCACRYIIKMCYGFHTCTEVFLEATHTKGDNKEQYMHILEGRRVRRETVLWLLRVLTVNRLRGTESLSSQCHCYESVKGAKGVQRV